MFNEGIITFKRLYLVYEATYDQILYETHLKTHFIDI